MAALDFQDNDMVNKSLKNCFWGLSEAERFKLLSEQLPEKLNSGNWKLKLTGVKVFLPVFITRDFFRDLLRSTSLSNEEWIDQGSRESWKNVTSKMIRARKKWKTKYIDRQGRGKKVHKRAKREHMLKDCCCAKCFSVVQLCRFQMAAYGLLCPGFSGETLEWVAISSSRCMPHAC